MKFQDHAIAMLDPPALAISAARRASSRRPPPDLSRRSRPDGRMYATAGGSVSVRGARGPGGGGAHAPRLLVPAGHQRGVGEVDSPPVGSRREDRGDARVERLPARRHDVLINRLAGEGVPEAVPAGGAI